MFNLDPEKLLILAIVAVLVLGPDKLPQAARQAGAAWRTLTQFRHRMEAEVRGQLPDLPSSSEIARLARSPTALLNRLSTLDGHGTPGEADLAAANGNGHVDDPPGDTAPVSPTTAAAAQPAPAPAPLPEEVASFGDPSLN